MEFTMIIWLLTPSLETVSSRVACSPNRSHDWTTQEGPYRSPTSKVKFNRCILCNCSSPLKEALYLTKRQTVKCLKTNKTVPSPWLIILAHGSAVDPSK